MAARQSLPAQSGLHVSSEGKTAAAVSNEGDCAVSVATALTPPPVLPTSRKRLMGEALRIAQEPSVPLDPKKKRRVETLANEVKSLAKAAENIRAKAEVKAAKLERKAEQVSKKMKNATAEIQVETLLARLRSNAGFDTEENEDNDSLHIFEANSLEGKYLLSKRDEIESKGDGLGILTNSSFRATLERSPTTRMPQTSCRDGHDGSDDDLTSDDDDDDVRKTGSMDNGKIPSAAPRAKSIQHALTTNLFVHRRD